jgi:glucosamine--fructose-6-phosphate aminotransferase (isomerizing)
MLSSKPGAEEYLIEGINILQNRGYDSAGICTWDASKKLKLTKLATDLVKKVDCINMLSELGLKNHK